MKKLSARRHPLLPIVLVGLSALIITTGQPPFGILSCISLLENDTRRSQDDSGPDDFLVNIILFAQYKVGTSIII